MTRPPQRAAHLLFPCCLYLPDFGFLFVLINDSVRSSVIQNKLCPREVSCLLVGEAGCNFSFSLKLWDGRGHWKEVFSTLLHSAGCLQEGFVEEYNGFLEVSLGPCWSQCLVVNLERDVLTITGNLARWRRNHFSTVWQEGNIGP